MSTPTTSNVVPLHISNGGKGSLLVAWRDPQVRSELSYRLRREGFSVSEAASAEEVLDSFASREFGMIVCERELDDDDAFWMLKKLSFTRLQLPMVPVVLVGHGVLGSDVRDVTTLNIREVLEETASADQVVDAVKRCI